MTLTTLLTHLIAAAAGWLACYLLVPRLVEAREIDGHTVLELHTNPGGDVPPKKRSGPNWPSVIVLLVAAFVLLGGIQQYIAKQQDDDRTAADRAYSRCLGEWAEDVTMTLQQVRDSGTRVTTAERARDAAVDQVLAVVARAREIPPRATEADFADALAEAIRARAKLDAAQAEADRVRSETEYVLPEAVCSR